MTASKLRIGLTLGDPCGIGPELWVRILCRPLDNRGGQSAETATQDAPESASRQSTWTAASAQLSVTAPAVQRVLFGDAGVLSRAAAALGLSAEWERCLASGDLQLIEVTALPAQQAQPGCPTQASGAAQVAYLEAAIAAAEAGGHESIVGMCTAPIHKASAKAAGLAFPGHTELLGQRLRRASTEVMMLAGPSLRVALATTHLALSQVPGVLTVEGLRDVIVTTALALRDDFAIARPRLWVAALNPHAGESGHFGDEESRIIKPAMSAALRMLHDASDPDLLPACPQVPAGGVPAPTTYRGAPFDLVGPLVPDVLFRAAVQAPPAERPDAIVAMYHDQGLIPLKLLDFDQAVNITLGLRVVRTSPDHGVAYDIAGRGLARPDSQAAALTWCERLSRARRCLP